MLHTDFLSNIPKVTFFVEKIEWPCFISMCFQMSNFHSIFHLLYRVIQSSAPPPFSAKIERFYERLTNAFPNTTYSKIFWRVSIPGIENLRHTKSFAKIDRV